MFWFKVFIRSRHFRFMDSSRNTRKNILLGNEKGQTAVEYILLLAVIVSVTTMIFNSDFVRDYFGENGTFVRTFKRELEYSYRHAVPPTRASTGRINNQNYRSANHKSYRYNGNTRFFGALNGYPQR